jgi:hypothetical protein
VYNAACFPRFGVTTDGGSRARRAVAGPCSCSDARPLSTRSRKPPAIDILKVLGPVYLLAGPEGNTLIQVGSQGVLVVDTQRDQDAADVARRHQEGRRRQADPA